MTGLHDVGPVDAVVPQGAVDGHIAAERWQSKHPDGRKTAGGRTIIIVGRVDIDQLSADTL